jgi:2-polyprenyl-3-methyl-5-hydroxy-6-metoxy-1,4-benzoquinol methylase
MSGLLFTGERIVPEASNCEPHFAEKMRQEHICRYYFAAQLVQGKNVLDVGCGVGYGSRILADHNAARVEAFDIDIEAVSHARKYYCRENIVFHRASAEEFDLGEGVFDVVVCFELIEHVSCQESVLRMIRRALKSDGVVFISTPRNLERKRSEFHVNELNLNEFLDIIDKNFPYKLLYIENNHFTSLITCDPPPKFIEPIYMRKQFTTDQCDYFICIASMTPIGHLHINPSFVMNDDKYVLLLEHDVKALRDIEQTLYTKNNELNAINSELFVEISSLRKKLIDVEEALSKTMTGRIRWLKNKIGQFDNIRKNLGFIQALTSTIQYTHNRLSSYHAMLNSKKNTITCTDYYRIKGNFFSSSQCGVCGYASFVIYEKRFDSTANELRTVYLCRNCGLLYMEPLMSSDEQGDSAKQYYSNQTETEYINNNKSLINILLREIYDIKYKIFVDYGCGSGITALAAAYAGFSDVYGIDINIENAKNLSSKYPIPKHLEFYTSIKDIPKKADIVMLWHTLEHIPKAYNFLCELNMYCNKGNTQLFIQVPQYDTRYICMSHCNFFSETSMNYLLKRSGFIVDKFIYDNQASFMTVYAKNY